MAVTAAPRLKLTGICPPARGAVVSAVVRARPDAPAWIVVVDEPKEAEQLAEDIAFFQNAAQ